MGFLLTILGINIITNKINIKKSSQFDHSFYVDDNSFLLFDNYFASTFFIGVVVGRFYYIYTFI